MESASDSSIPEVSSSLSHVNDISSSEELSAPPAASFQAPPAQEQTSRPAESAGTYTVLTPVASGTEVYSGGGAQIDVSHAGEGYIMVKYDGNVAKIRVQVTRDGGSTYTYGLSASGV